MLVGYARVSTIDQNLDLQRDALKKVGVEKIYEDTLSGARADRPGLEEAIEYARPGDTLVIWRLDRLGRSLRDLIAIAEDLNSRGIGLKSLQEAIDTGSSGGKLIFHIFAALAEFERDLIRERVNSGLVAARARGKKGGRPQKLDTKNKALAIKLYNQKDYSISEICSMVGISKPTLYSYLQEQKTSPGKE